MVTRKPVPRNAAADPNAPPVHNMQDMRQKTWSAAASEAGADQIWAEEMENHSDQSKPRTVPPEDIPNALRPGMPQTTNYSSLETEENVWGEPVDRLAATAGNTSQGGVSDVSRVPTVLRPGGGANRPETNPFKRKPPGGSTSPGRSPGRGPGNAQPPTASFAQLSVNDTGSNPWGPAVDDSKPASTHPQVPSLVDADNGRDIWDSGKPSRQPTPGALSTSPALVSVPSESGSAVWDEKPPMRAPTPEEKIVLDEEEELEASNIWDDMGVLDKGKGAAKPPPPIPSQTSGGRIDEWNLIDHDAPPPAPLSRQSTWENFDDAPEAPDSSASPQQPAHDAPPSLPPRRSAEETTARPVPAQPPRHIAEPKNETYQIKVITWHDVEAAKNPRQSPILVQNANGPCPLVALVNALTLTTPAGINTPLVQTLRTREQVSLSLVVDAVFDELMSSRRHNPAEALPDVAELYEFLKGLHTGMNVNPRFIPTEDLIKAYKRTSLTHLHPSERGDMMPGTFEDTREMTLYSTFSIPLIHGWLPSKTDSVYDAFTRRAASYEDVQNLLFMEEELEDKLSSPHHQGLTEEEQAVYQDILTIKSFLSVSATQLTSYGLKVIREAMRPGSVAILFRNDHFSTLYRHPQTQQLFALVTDAGYASHEEIVWESLVDVNGEHAEFFSGDFRLVGGASHQSDGDSVPVRGSASASGGAWTTVQGRRGRSQAQTPPPDDQQPPLSPTHEQEDRDLALAMQLQEEEDERHRAEQARRRRESLLSEQFIEQQGRQPPTDGRNNNNQTSSTRGRNGTSNGNTASSNRRNSAAAASTATNASTTSVNSRTAAAGRGQTVRSLIPPVRAGRAVNRAADSEPLDDAPPSYEQAAKQAPYVPPPPGHAGPSSAGAGSRSNARSGGANASPPPPAFAPRPGGPGSPVSGRMPPGAGGRGGMRQGVQPPVGVGVGAVGREGLGRDRECVVM